MTDAPRPPEDWPFTANHGRKAKRRRNSWPAADKERFRRMWNAGDRVEEIADLFVTSRGAVYMCAAADPGCKPRRSRRKTGTGRQLPARDQTNQRRFTGAVAHEGQAPKIVLQPHHPASRKGTTFFPSTVIPAGRMVRLLKSGEHSRKIGKRVEKGHWRGFPIFTLTLEERETCPRTCLEWATCYGNNMPFAQRILDDGTLTKRLWGELAALNAEHPRGFLVRLHILGDFFSVEYVVAWRRYLSDFPALHVFGFTARRPPDPIGDALVLLVRDQADRFKLRFSGAGYETHSAEVVDKAADATGILCPAQRDENRCCATCALCWQSDVTISFLRH